MFQGIQPLQLWSAFLEMFQVLFQCLGQARAISIILTRCPKWGPTWKTSGPWTYFLLCAGTLWCFIPCMALTRCPKELQGSYLWNFISPMSKNLFQDNGPPSLLLFLADEIFLLQCHIGIDCKNGVDPLILGGTHSHRNMSSRVWATSYFFLTIGLYLHIRALY